MPWADIKRAAMATPLGFLETQTCALGADAQQEYDLLSSPVFGGPFPEEGVCVQDTQGQVLYYDRQSLQDLMSCRWASHLLLEDHRLLKERHLWAFPPPVSPSRPFGSVPSSEDVGCADLLRSGDFLFQHVYVASVGLVEGVDVGLGLFVCAFLAAGSVLGEYTGVLSRRRTEEDGVYGYGLPVVEPDLVINAKEFGNLLRLINHSDDAFNAELMTVQHEGLLHVVCRVLRDVMPGEQVLIHYGHRYWLPESRRHVRLPTRAAEGLEGRTGPRGQGYQGYQG